MKKNTSASITAVPEMLSSLLCARVSPTPSQLLRRMVITICRFGVCLFAMSFFFSPLSLEAGQKKSGKSKKSGTSLVKNKATKKKKSGKSNPSAQPSTSGGTSATTSSGAPPPTPTPAPTPEMITVQGGMLPEGSVFAGSIVKTFAIGTTEVSFEKWQSLQSWAVEKGYIFDYNGSGNGANYPVTNVSWFDVVKWCNAKSEKEGLIPVYQSNGVVYRSGQIVPTRNRIANGYRLPTTVESMWAARGGILSKNYIYSGSNDLNSVAWNPLNANTSKAVGTKSPNELGIYDMSGNVSEWSSDLSGYGYRYIYGGCWSDGNSNSFDISNPGTFAAQEYGFNHVGFRFARD